MEISGKTAIVTGAASGIGLSIATALAEAGANVVMADIEKDAVEQAAHRLSGTNKQVLPVRIDVTQEQSVIDALAEAEHRFAGALGVTAGLSADSAIAGRDRASRQYLIDANIRPILLARVVFLGATRARHTLRVKNEEPDHERRRVEDYRPGYED